MAQSIEYRDKYGVLEAFKMHSENGCPYFSIWQQRRLLVAHRQNDDDKGREFLENTLTFLEDSGTTAVYELRFYSSLGPGNKITDKTEYEGSLTFQLCMSDMQMMRHGGQYQPGGAGVNKQILDKLDQMQGELNILKSKELKEDVPEQEEIGSLGHILGVANKLLANPVIENIAVGLIKRFNIPYDEGGLETDGASLSGFDELDDDVSEKINNAIHRIMQKDPAFPDVLVKLANLIEKDPKKYNLAKSLL